MEETFYVDTLIICLKLCIKFIKIKENCQLFNSNSELDIIKYSIQLNFWDNPKIVNYTCKFYQFY